MAEKRLPQRNAASSRRTPPRVAHTRGASESICPHYPDCAGCALIGTAYGEQLRIKEETVRAALASHAPLSAVPIAPIVGSPRAFGYRNQAKLVARRTRRELLLGVYKPGTHHVVDISGCPVHHPIIAVVLRAVRGILERREVSIYDEAQKTGWLRYVLVRASLATKSAQVILVVSERNPRWERELAQILRRARYVRSVIINVNATSGNVIFDKGFIAMTQETTLIERVGSIRLKSHAGAFLQANIQAARRLYDRVLEWAAPNGDETAVDLYCGVGAISFYLGSRARRVYGIEESTIAIGDAKENIRLNGFHNVRFFAGRTADVLPSLLPEIGNVDLVTLNPPRKGADDATRAAIVGCHPSRIVYVSCDASTLARDLAWFAEHGYATDRVQPFDLLPQTEHVECVALMRRA